MAADKWRSEVKNGGTWFWGRYFMFWPDSVGLHPGKSRPTWDVEYRPICLPPPPGPRLPLPHHVFPGSLHLEIGGSWAHIQHLSVLDTSVCSGPSHSHFTNPQKVFSHSQSQLSPPQEGRTALPESLDYVSPRASPRRLTLLCNHHYAHKCLLDRVTRSQRSSIIQ